jgi:hypothetical protein
LISALLVSLALVRVSGLKPRDFLVPRHADLVDIVTRLRGRLSAS